MSVKLLTEHRLEFVSLKGGCTGSSESTLVKMQICVSSRCIRYAGYIHISKRRKNSDNYHKSSFSCMQCAVSCSSSLKLFFISCKPMKRRHSWAIMFCVLSPLSCTKWLTACYPILKTTTPRGLIVGFFMISNMSVNHYPVPLSAADTISSAGPKVGPRSPPPRGCDKLI